MGKLGELSPNNAIEIVEYLRMGHSVRRDFILSGEGGDRTIMFRRGATEIENLENIRFTLVKIRGDVTSYGSANLLRQIFLAHTGIGIRRYVLDLSQLRSLGSSGISALLLLLAALERQGGGKVYIFGFSPVIKNILNSVRIMSLFIPVDSFSEAEQLCATG